jgi:hypothetical protein
MPSENIRVTRGKVALHVAVMPSPAQTDRCRTGLTLLFVHLLSEPHHGCRERR